MADQQPENHPAAGMPDPTRVDSGDEPSTVDAPARWSGSAAVPPPAPKKSRWSRRNERPAEPEPADHWANTPAVDPWEGQDTPWEPFTLAEPPAPVEMPPTRVEPPAEMPRTRIEPPPAAPQPAGPPPAAPPPVTPPPLPPPATSRRELKRERKRLAKAHPPVNRLPVQSRPPAPPAPPPWVARPPERPLPPPRRKRRWGRRLALLSLLGVVCCCGLPFAYFQFPTARQHPVRAVFPQSFADLSKRDDQASERAAERLAEQVNGPGAGTDGVFTAVYGDKRGKRVTVFGVTGFRLNPGGDVRSQLDRLTTDFNLTGIEEFDLGEAGAHERCSAGRVDGNSVVVCAWADHGSLATVLLTRRSVADSAELVGRLRNEVLTPG